MSKQRNGGIIDFDASLTPCGTPTTIDGARFTAVSDGRIMRLPPWPRGLSWNGQCFVTIEIRTQ